MASEASRVGGGKRPALIGDGDKLFVQVTASGSVSWLFRYRYAGRPRAMGLGPLHSVGPKIAREEAGRLRQVLHGRRQRREDREYVTFCFADAATADAFRAAFGGERIEGDERGR